MDTALEFTVGSVFCLLAFALVMGFIGGLLVRAPWAVMDDKP